LAPTRPEPAKRLTRPEPAKRKRRRMRAFGRFFLYGFALIGLLVAGGIGITIWIAAHHEEESLPAKIVLRIDLENGLIEAPSDSPLARLQSNGAYALRDVVEAIELGAADKKVSGLYVTFDGSPLSMARAQEIRDAVHKFRASGKPTVAFAETMGESGNGTVSYFLASAFERIWLQPSGDLAMTGFMAETPFIRDALDKLDITPQFSGRYEYKTAIATFTEKSFTKEHRQSLKGLVENWSGQVIDGVATDRKITREQVRTLIDQAPVLAGEALEAGLVDRLGYHHEAEADVTQNGGEFVDIDAYLHKNRPHPKNATKIALIPVVGAITRGNSEGTPLGGEEAAGSHTVVKALEDAGDDDEIKAVVLRIDSPGGSYVAADTIWRAVKRLREQNKPVIASMGGVAASGGYFIAMGADKIVAQPGTITGSIGVFSGKFALQDFSRKLGITWDEVHEGANAPMWSEVQAFSPEAFARLNQMLDHIYEDFTGKAAEARGLKAEEMDALARGRIWTGSEAKRVGLVDELGGVSTAFALARQAAGLGPEVAAELVPYPPAKSMMELIADFLKTGQIPSDAASRIPGVSSLVQVRALLQPFASLVGLIHAAQPGVQTRMIPLETNH